MLDAKDEPVIYTRFGNMLESDLEKWVGFEINDNDIAFVKEHRLKADLQFGDETFPAGTSVKREAHTRVIVGVGALEKTNKEAAAATEQGFLKP